MHRSLAILILTAAAVGATLVGLRHQRLRIVHEMVQEHRRIDDARQTLWKLQAQMNQHLKPGEIRDQLQRSRVAMEPVVEPAPSPEDEGTRLVLGQADHGGRVRSQPAN